MRTSPAAPALAGALLLAAAAACGGGGGGDCGPGETGAAGLTVTVDATLHAAFGGFAASANNDCPPPGGGSVTSLTIAGNQAMPAADGQFLIFCLPRPDQVGGDPISLGDDTMVQVIQAGAQDNFGCTYALDRSASLAGATLTFTGFCHDGTDPAGFALGLSGTVPLLRTCPIDGGPAGGDPVTATLDGVSSVAGPT